MATNATITDYFSLKVPQVADAETDSIHSDDSSSDEEIYEEIEESCATVMRGLSLPCLIFEWALAHSAPQFRRL